MPNPLSVLILGSGGREHALAWKAAQSPLLKKLYAAPGSDAIAALGRLSLNPDESRHSGASAPLAERVPLDILNGTAVAEFCAKTQIDLVIIGPEAPLERGVADALIKEGVKVFGPSRAGARLEFSKSFAKDFMRRHHVPTAAWSAFDSFALAKEVIAKTNSPLVIKADGLAAGKGVRVCQTSAEALEAAADFMERKTLGEAGGKIVVEECLAGPEVSIMMFCDGKDYALLPASCDHKRLKDRDEGPNTGGMGAYAPAQLDEKTRARIKSEVLRPIMAGLAADKLDYRGLLYVGVMLASDGPKVLEFNTRFGDPETQAVLPLLKSDLLELALACAERRLAKTPVEAHPGACVCVVLASEGYPARPVTGRRIIGLAAAETGDAVVFHAGTARDGKDWITTGGRVLGVSARGADIAQAKDTAYAAASHIRFEGMQYRRDIAGKILSMR